MVLWYHVAALRALWEFKPWGENNPLDCFGENVNPWSHAGGDNLSGTICCEPRLSCFVDSGTLLGAEAHSLGFSGVGLKVF